MSLPFIIFKERACKYLAKQNEQYYNFSGKNLQQLLGKALQGDSHSYEKLSSLIRAIAYSYFKSKYAYGKLNSLDDADDLANDVFITFAKQYHDVEKVEHWLRRVLFLTFVNFYKKQKQSYEYNDELYKDENREDDISKLDLHRISSIIKTLKDPKDKIIKMRFWEGLKFNEIAEKLNRKEPAIKKMFYRTLDEIKNKLE